ncbi:TraB/GumN family protein [Solitalea longa]|uniref:TraB/GumN family protein n=1 Tax=Solitalea longa TaxID=2079460 RepID=A0A2S5A0L5_9SPHI|nr:TraB/GumN family protein [Solitalea longa]POY35673.1 TraB/GumN family protein [Solitalea longa]
MKKIFLTLIALVATTFTFSAYSQQKTESKNSLLWEISGKGLQKPSYLYGTIHMICEDDFFISEKLKKVSNSTDRLILEINFNDPAEITALQKSMMSEIPLSQQLTPIQYSFIDSLVKSKTPYSLKQLDKMNLMALSSIITASTLPCKQPKVYELELMTMAKTRNVPIGALETVNEQVFYFNKAFSKEFLVSQMMIPTEYTEYFGKLIQAYKNENLNDLYAMLNDSKFSTEDVTKWLLIERNKNWVKSMPALMQKESVLFAVGSGHLGGKNGVIELLKQQGYTVKPVIN